MHRNPDVHQESGEHPIRLESLTHNACCCRVSIGSKMYALCDMGIGLSGLSYWMRWLAFEDYTFIDEQELVDQTDISEKRLNFIHLVLKKCGGEGYVRETDSETKYASYAASCVLFILASVGSIIGGSALLYSTLMRNFSKVRTSLIWTFLYVQIPSVVLSLIAAILITDKGLCELDYHKERFHSFILIFTILMAILYKPHEILISVLYLRDLENKGAVVRAILERRKVRRLLAEKRRLREVEDEKRRVSRSVSRVVSIMKTKSLNLKNKGKSFPNINAPSINSSHSTVVVDNQDSETQQANRQILIPSSSNQSSVVTFNVAPDLFSDPSFNSTTNAIIGPKTAKQLSTTQITIQNDIENIPEYHKDKTKGISWNIEPKPK